MTLDSWPLTLDSWPLLLAPDWTQKNITLDSWLFTFEFSLIIYLQPVINEIQNVLLMRIPEISCWIWFKEVQFVQTPHNFFLWTRMCSEKRNPRVLRILKTNIILIFVCVWKCVKDTWNLIFMPGSKTPSPQMTIKMWVFLFLMAYYDSALKKNLTWYFSFWP